MQTALVEIIDALRVYADGLGAADEAIVGRARSLAADRRAHVRLRPGDLERPIRARLKHGPLLTLVDVSAGGVLIETRARLTPGSRVVLEFITPDAQRTKAVTSRILRAEVASITGGLQYRGGCAFSTPVPIPELSGRFIEPPEVTRRRLQSEMLATLTRMQHGADPAVARLVETVIDLAREGRPARLLISCVEQKLRETVPLLAVTVGTTPTAEPAAEALCFNALVPADQDGGGRVIFRPACTLDDSQFRLLEGGAAVLSLLYAWYRQTPRVFF